MLSIRYHLRESNRPRLQDYIAARGFWSSMKLSGNAKALAILLVVFVFCDFLISPLVFETRGSDIIGNPASLRWLVVLFGGLLLNIIALVLVAFRPRTAAILAIIGSIAYIVVSFADQAGLVSSLRAPVVVADIELVAVIVLAGVLFLASRVYLESAPSDIRPLR
jgi:hypothetical protein